RTGSTVRHQHCAKNKTTTVKLITREPYRSGYRTGPVLYSWNGVLVVRERSSVFVSSTATYILVQHPSAPGLASKVAGSAVRPRSSAFRELGSRCPFFFRECASFLRTRWNREKVYPANPFVASTKTPVYS
uniref:Uncharacterized protein n=1 Tax=Anopheles christyi TaxID=43041 RepID=A0A182K5E3_9DIPT